MRRWLIALLLLVTPALAMAQGSVSGNNGGVGANAGPSYILPGTWTAPQTFTGSVVIQSNQPGLNAVNGSFYVNTTYDMSAASQGAQGFSPNQLTTNLPLAGNNNNVWQNFNSVVNLIGPGTQSGEINVIHSVFTCSANCNDTSFAENFEGSSNNMGALNTFSVVLSKPGNGSTGTSQYMYGFNTGLVNDNTTPGSVGTYVGLNCNSMVGGGSLPTFYYCLANGDVNQQIFTVGPVGIGTRSSSSNALLVDALTSNAADATFLIQSNSQANALMELANQDALELNFDTFSPTGALYISDRNGHATYGNHIAFHQSSGISVTNGTLDNGASDVAGTITLSAGAPVVTFRVPFQSAPHALVYSTGTNPVCTPSTTHLTCTGGSNGDKVTYVVFQ